MSMIASGAPGYITHPTPSCPRLAGTCTGTGDHDVHWSAPNELPSPRAHTEPIPAAYAQLFSIESADGQASEPTISVVFGFEGDLALSEADQLLAGVREFGARLETQILELEAARRQWEATR